jgi:L-asparaginase II
MHNPVLIELTRGAQVESRHTGSLAIVRPNGEIVVAMGDVKRPVFSRSAIKSLQALPLIETGAADRFALGPAEIALACASHSGTPRHVATARGMLEKAGLTHAALGCGAHDPGDEAAARAMLRRDETPTALVNNCSGKHSGMVSTAVHMGEPVDGYLRHDHPVQVRIARSVAEMTGADLGEDVRGIDGCSAPNWAIPLTGLAQAFARYVTGDRLAPDRKAAARRVQEACWAAPEMVSGPGRLDTLAMTALPGKIFLKTGAEGVYCGAFPATGLGFALKIDDGAKRASHAVAAALLQHVFPGFTAPGLLGPTRNWRGIEVGETRAAADLLRVLDKLRAA